MQLMQNLPTKHFKTKGIIMTDDNLEQVDDLYVDLADLKVLLDLQKDLELLKTRVELYEHKVTIVQMQLKNKYKMTDTDTINPQNGQINRSK